MTSPNVCKQCGGQGFYETNVHDGPLGTIAKRCPCKSNSTKETETAKPCQHRNLHPGRYEKAHTVCLDCRAEVQIAVPASGTLLLGSSAPKQTEVERYRIVVPDTAKDLRYLVGRARAAEDLAKAPPGLMALWPGHIKREKLLCIKDDECVQCGSPIEPQYSTCAGCDEDDEPWQYNGSK